MTTLTGKGKSKEILPLNYNHLSFSVLESLQIYIIIEKYRHVVF